MNKLEIINLFLHDIVNGLGVLKKKVNFVKFWSKRSNFEPIVNKFDLLVSDKPTNERKTQFLGENKLFLVLVIVKRTRLHYTKFRSKHCIRQKCFIDDFFRSNQR